MGLYSKIKGRETNTLIYMFKIVFLVIIMMFLSCKGIHRETVQEKVSPLELKNTDETPELGVTYNTDSTTVKFVGVITNVKNDCWVDGTCSIEVDNKWWVAITYGKRDPSRIPKERGQIIGIRFTKDNESIGKKVTIYAKIRDKNRLTVEGSKEYYVKVIE